MNSTLFRVVALLGASLPVVLGTPAGAVVQTPADGLPVKWSPRFRLKDLDEVKSELREHVYIDDQEQSILLAKGGSRKRIHTCAGYLEVRGAQGFSPATPEDQQLDDYFAERCRTLGFLSRAIPARESYVRDQPFTAESAREMPPCLGIGGDSSFMARVRSAMRNGSSYAGLFPDVKSRVQKGALIMSTPGEEVGVERLGWGDVNGDGYDDLIVKVDTRATQGTFHSVDVLVLTKKPNDKVFRVVDGDPESCPSNVDARFDTCSLDELNQTRDKFRQRFDDRRYHEAFEGLYTWKEKCYAGLDDDAKMSILAGLSSAALKLGDPTKCLSLLDEGAPLDKSVFDDRTRRQVSVNRKLCSKR